MSRPARKPYVEKSLVQVLIDELTRRGGAGFVYRGWWWANHSDPAANLAFKADWGAAFMGRNLSADDVRDGLRRWVVERGVDVPPTPGEFVRFLVPSLSDAGRRGLRSIREVLGG